MHKRYDHTAFEKKWQEAWKASGIYDVGDRDPKKEKEYVLVEWPYPSGNLHIGHWQAFAVPDIYVRQHRMMGKQVLFPIGFDAFGLPAENAAIKHGLDPKTWTDQNIEHMRAQLISMGNAFSWDKSTSSTDPEYYAWTQWMFTQFFEKGIAYRGTGIVNWCPGCNTVIANEQVLADGTCERSGDVIEKREMPQWMLRITKYADQLIDDLGELGWPEYIKEAQRQWIGRKQGAELPFALSTGDTATVFTTRPDTLYGATYIAIAPEHDLVTELLEHITNRDNVKAYIHLASQLEETERTNANREKTGVQLEGITAINPATNEHIPVFIADYVLKQYGTGVVMGVPAHDERDLAFALKYGIAIKQVVVPCPEDSNNPPKEGFKEVKRDTVIVHLRDNSTGKYALLDWHGTLEGTTTAIMGGIEAGQTPEEAALREIEEETALTGVRILKQARWITAARYHASHKNENRCAHSYALLAEIDNLNEQGVIADAEQAAHTLVWKEEKDVRKSLTPAHQRLVWDLLQNDNIPLTEPGYLINSGEFDGMDSETAKTAITNRFGGTLTSTYRLRDWSIGRQRYWGVPIPIVYDPEGKAHIVPKEHLPWKLPTDVDFTPTGEPPLAKSAELRERVTRIFGEGWTPEVETMDTFVDSSWYFLRYLDAHDTEAPASLSVQKEWMPVDVYFGGSEHTTMHLLYSRFWQKALYDLGLVIASEPYALRINRGLILGPDGNKMSKSKGNIIDPDEQVALLGADTVKMYLAFMGPYGEPSNYPWDLRGIAGLRRFLERVYGLSEHITEAETEETRKMLHRMIEKVTSDIQAYKFNTAISTLMIFLNHAERAGLSTDSYHTFLKVLAPFAPHLTEELWHLAGNLTSIHTEAWPKADTSLLTEHTVTISVQIAGKMRGRVSVPTGADEKTVLEAIHADVNLKERLADGSERVIYVPNKIINIILKRKE